MLVLQALSHIFSGHQTIFRRGFEECFMVDCAICGTPSAADASRNLGYPPH